MFGLPALADAVTSLAYTGGRGRTADQIASLIPLIEGRGACRHPDGATQLVRSALWAFEADARWHDHRGPCAGVRRAPLLPVPGEEHGEWPGEAGWDAPGEAAWDARDGDDEDWDRDWRRYEGRR
jgi:hypothetical protein